MSGIRESALITKSIQDKLISSFNAVFKNHEAALLVWGSVARNEMGPNSDVDIILLLSNSELFPKILLFSTHLKQQFTNRVDLLEAQDVKTLELLASINGTDRQAVLLAEPLCGDRKILKLFLRLQHKLLKQNYENAREAIHTYASIINVSKHIYSSREADLKFNRGFLKTATFPFLLIRLFEKKKHSSKNTSEAVHQLRRMGIISTKKEEDFLQAFNFLLSVRNQLQLLVNNEKYTLKRKFIPKLAKKLRLTPKKLTRHLATSKRIFLQIDDSAKNYLIDTVTKQKNKKNVLLRTLLDFDEIENVILSSKISSRISEYLAILLAHRSNNQQALEMLRSMFPQNWYVLYGLAINTKTSSSTLHKLIEPDASSLKLEQLYNSFAWRNMRLYVAKNINASRHTLQFIVNHPKSRPMDIAAATDRLRRSPKHSHSRH